MFVAQDVQSKHYCKSYFQRPQDRSLLSLITWLPEAAPEIEKSLECRNCCVITQGQLRLIFKDAISTRCDYFPVIDTSALNPNLPMNRRGGLKLYPFSEKENLVQKGVIVKDPYSAFYFEAPCDFSCYRFKDLTDSDIDFLFTAVEQHPIMDWTPQKNGCWDRALLSELITLSYGVDPSVVFMISNRTLSDSAKIGYLDADGEEILWDFHAALSLEGKSGHPHIFDRCTASTPLSHTQWLQKIHFGTDPKSLHIAWFNPYQDTNDFENADEVVAWLPCKEIYYLDRAEVGVKVLREKDNELRDAVTNALFAKITTLFSSLPQIMSTVTLDLTERFRMRNPHLELVLEPDAYIRNDYVMEKLELSISKQLPLVTEYDLTLLFFDDLIESTEVDIAGASYLLGAYMEQIGDNRDLYYCCDAYYQVLQKCSSITMTSDIEYARYERFEKELLTWKQEIESQGKIRPRRFVDIGNLQRINEALSKILRDKSALDDARKVDEVSEMDIFFSDDDHEFLDAAI